MIANFASIASYYQVNTHFSKQNGIEIWARPISPVRGEFFSYAIAFLNQRTDGTPSQVIIFNYLLFLY